MQEVKVNDGHSIPCSRGAHSGVTLSPVNLLEVHICGPRPDPPGQTLWGGGARTPAVPSLQGDSGLAALGKPCSAVWCTEQVTELRSAELNSESTLPCSQAVWTGVNGFTFLSLSASAPNKRGIGGVMRTHVKT